MRKSDLHPRLQATCVPIPNRSGCFAVMPEPVPMQIDAPDCHGLFAVARRELEVLRALINTQPEQAKLLMGMLNRREAVDSSQIEGTQTNFDGLLIHELDDVSDVAHDQDAAQTLAYVRAWMVGCDSVVSTGLNIDLISRLHGILMAGQDRVRPGQIRLIQNYIGSTLELAQYIPPPAERVLGLLEDLTRLFHVDEAQVMAPSILMRSAIAHVQFEAIHPFQDGNGRIGRLLLPLMYLAENEPPIHLATFLKIRQREYYQALIEAQTRLNWAPWLRLYLECVIASCRHTQQLFGTLQRIFNLWQGQLSETRKRRDAAVWRLIEYLRGQPIVSITKVAEVLAVSFPVANSAVNTLVGLDILRPMNEHKRNRLFQAHQITNALYTGLDQVLAEASRF